jgi:hypothetical protein
LSELAKNYTQKIQKNFVAKLSKIWLRARIWKKSKICPDPGSRRNRNPDPGSGSVTLVLAEKISFFALKRNSWPFV